MCHPVQLPRSVDELVASTLGAQAVVANELCSTAASAAESQLERAAYPLERVLTMLTVESSADEGSGRVSGRRSRDACPDRALTCTQHFRRNRSTS